MNWGHYEKMIVQGSKRKVNVFVPSILNNLIPAFVFFALSAPIMMALFTPDEGDSLLESPLLLLLGLFFELLFFAVGVAAVWMCVCERRDVKRMRNGELVLKTGELFIISRESIPGKYNSTYCYRFALRSGQDKRDVEIYEMPEKIYDKFCEHGGCGKEKVRNAREKGKLFYSLNPRVYLVEVAVLVPKKGAEFRMIDLSGKLERIVGDNMLGESHCGQFPLFNGTVADIFYKKGVSYQCIVSNGDLFEWSSTR